MGLRMNVGPSPFWLEPCVGPPYTSLLILLPPARSTEQSYLFVPPPAVPIGTRGWGRKRNLFQHPLAGICLHFGIVGLMWPGAHNADAHVPLIEIAPRAFKNTMCISSCYPHVA